MIKRFLALLFMPLFSMAQETLLLKSPSVSKDKIVFSYAGNIWITDIHGYHPRQLTENQSVNSDPLLSPNGKWIAFTGIYNNNTDIYVMPTAGGIPKRLTFHPVADQVKSWDGNEEIVFSSIRESVHLLERKLYQVNINTGKEEALPLPEASQGSVSPDGRLIAYNQSMDVNEWAAFRLYRGGDIARVWIYDKIKKHIQEIPAAHSNSLSPVWTKNGFIYFLSDRDNHYMNVYKYNLKTGDVLAVTAYKDFDVKSLYSNGNKLAYEQGGKIFILNSGDDKSTHIPIRINIEQPSRKPYFADASGLIYNMNLSPTGVSAIIEARGEILTVPALNGEIRNLTNSPGANDRDPAWSPDGRYIAFFSDESGEYQLNIIDQKGSSATTKIALNAGNFYYHPIWSPNSKMIAFENKARKIFIIDLQSRKISQVDQDLYTAGPPQLNYAWSPDSKWLAYNNRISTNLNAIFIFDVEKKSRHQVTDGRSEANYPMFSKDEKYLFFTGNAEYGPAQSWFDMTSKHYYTANNVYAMMLSAREPSILQSDSSDDVHEEKRVVTLHDSTKPTNTLAGEYARSGIKATTIDFDHIERRVVPLPIPAKNISLLAVDANDHLYYLEQDYMATDYTLYDYVISKKKINEVIKGINSYVVSNDGQKILYSAPNNLYGIISVPGKANLGDGKLRTNKLKIYVDPQKEWKQMYDEVWRLERDFLYVENANGADLSALKNKYSVFLPFVNNRYDLNDLFNRMLGELVLGHVFVKGGDFPKTNVIAGGLLGADYVVDNGYYRFKKIYSGLNWNPDLVAPLTQPGLDIKEGQYLVAVNGIPLTEKQNLYSNFQNTAGKETVISINSHPTLKGAKNFTVIPIGNELKLRLMNWIENNRKKVDSLSGGKISYVYLPNMANDGYTFFNRYFFTQLDKQAIIIDDRDNTGGDDPDYVMDFLDRQTLLYGNKRDGKPFSIPYSVINGPKAMLINTHSLSCGDLLPYMFKAKHMGPLVGTRTFGILVGNTGNPDLIDGGQVTTPNFAVFDKNRNWIIEQEGVSPDVEIDNNPVDVMNGKDTQLEKAVQLILKDLKNTKPIEQPIDPIRVSSY